VSLQLRPRDAGSPFYCPEYDIRYAFTAILRTAFYGMAEGSRDPWLSALMHAHSFSEEDLVPVLEATKKLITTATTPTDKFDPEAQLRDAGFFDINPFAANVLFQKIGQLALGFYLKGIREFARPNEPVPDLHELSNIADSISATISRELALNVQNNETSC
jgi:hypothetical protein